MFKNYSLECKETLLAWCWVRDGWGRGWVRELEIHGCEPWSLSRGGLQIAIHRTSEDTGSEPLPGPLTTLVLQRRLGVIPRVH